MEIKREDVIAYSYYDEKGRLIAIIDRDKLAKLIDADEVRWTE